jgi:hypothetical protein
VGKEEKKKENLVVGREYRGRQISKENGSWTIQKEKEDINECFGEPHGK